MFPATPVEIKRLSAADHDAFAALIRIFKAAFDMAGLVLPAEAHLRQLLDREDFYVVVALQEGKVAGGLTAYTLQQYYSREPLVYLYDLAVDSRCQRQGIGRKLLTWLCAYCRSAGATEIFVQAEEEDTHALDFYHAIGGTAQKVVQFTIC